jgi:hypothetical protein
MGADAGAPAAARPDLFTRIYDRDGFVLYALPMTMSGALPAAMSAESTRGTRR